MNQEQNANILDSDDGYYIASITRRWGGLYDNELSEIAIQILCLAGDGACTRWRTYQPSC
ncbi:20855_t:CDS:2 [Entrophospora sp. SA101]|nr:20855_t:CDS:2 [Entrophospora sp. SA101]